MMGYLLKRLAFMGVTVLAVCALTFFLMNIIPGGTAELILKHTVLELEEIPTDEQIAEISTQYNLHDPFIFSLETGWPVPCKATWEAPTSRRSRSPTFSFSACLPPFSWLLPLCPLPFS